MRMASQNITLSQTSVCPSNKSASFWRSGLMTGVGYSLPVHAHASSFMESSLFGKYPHKTYHLWHCFITRETQIPLLMLWENVQHGTQLWRGGYFTSSLLRWHGRLWNSMYSDPKCDRLIYSFDYRKQQVEDYQVRSLILLRTVVRFQHLYPYPSLPPIELLVDERRQQQQPLSKEAWHRGSRGEERRAVSGNWESLNYLQTSERPRKRDGDWQTPSQRLALLYRGSTTALLFSTHSCVLDWILSKFCNDFPLNCTIDSMNPLFRIISLRRSPRRRSRPTTKPAPTPPSSGTRVACLPTWWAIPDRPATSWANKDRWERNDHSAL